MKIKLPEIKIIKLCEFYILWRAIPVSEITQKEMFKLGSLLSDAGCCPKWACDRYLDGSTWNMEDSSPISELAAGIACS